MRFTFVKIRTKTQLFHTVSRKSRIEIPELPQTIFIVGMEHLIELGPESLLEGGSDGTEQENNKFWFGATWDSKKKEYYTDETGELLDRVADGLDKVKFGVLVSLNGIDKGKWSSVVISQTDNSKAGFP